MEFTVHEEQGRCFVEGQAGQPFMRGADDVTGLIEACFEHGARGVLLYPENLAPRFFDLSSGDAGEILQKLRNYHIRLAIVRTPSMRPSSRFHELVADEQRGPYFRLFDERAAAWEWLAAG